MACDGARKEISSFDSEKQRISLQEVHPSVPGKAYCNGGDGAKRFPLGIISGSSVHLEIHCKPTT